MIIKSELGKLKDIVKNWEDDKQITNFFLHDKIGRSLKKLLEEIKKDVERIKKLEEKL